jgi:hypothetical protein
MERVTLTALVGAAAILGFLVSAVTGRGETVPFVLALLGSAVAEVLENRAMARQDGRSWRVAIYAAAAIAVWAVLIVAAVRASRSDRFLLSALLGLLGGRSIGDILTPRPAAASPRTAPKP